ncbi:hypothetical protein N7453_007162 [Penicillium expansum]|nr:hypothetical protein N7453_007162 [Penicillium expansum]
MVKIVDRHLVCVLWISVPSISPRNSPFHSLSAPTIVLCLLYTTPIYAHSIVNIDPSTPLHCRDSDASQ